MNDDDLIRKIEDGEIGSWHLYRLRMRSSKWRFIRTKVWNKILSLHDWLMWNAKDLVFWSMSVPIGIALYAILVPYYALSSPLLIWFWSKRSVRRVRDSAVERREYEKRVDEMHAEFERSKQIEEAKE